MSRRTFPAAWAGGRCPHPTLNAALSALLGSARRLHDTWRYQPDWNAWHGPTPDQHVKNEDRPCYVSFVGAYIACVLGAAEHERLTPDDYPEPLRGFLHTLATIPTDAYGALKALNRTLPLAGAADEGGADRRLRLAAERAQRHLTHTRFYDVWAEWQDHATALYILQRALRPDNAPTDFRTPVF